MARPLRIEFSGAVYHVTSRGDRGEPIFLSDSDRLAFLRTLARACERFDASVMAYCLMGNHYHVIVQTRQANLSLVMRHLNGVYTQGFNARHGQVGHLFQGRFHAVLVDRDAYLLEACRYVDLNPVRAGVVERPDAWPWSSHLALVGRASPPAWLDTTGLAALILGRNVDCAADLTTAWQRYAEWVAAGRDLRLWERALRQQIFLGDETFVATMLARAASHRLTSTDIPRHQRRPMRTLDEWLADEGPTDDALLGAYRQGHCSMREMGRALGMTTSRVSRLIRSAKLREERRGSAPRPKEAKDDN
jgi:putative transposase